MSVSGRRRCRERGSAGDRDARIVLAGRTDAKDLQEMTVDGELGVAAEVADQLVDRAGRKRHRGSAAGTDQVVTVAGRTDDVGRVPARLQNPRQHVDRSQDLEGPVDRRSTQPRLTCFELRNDLFSRERPFVAQNGAEDRTPRTGQAIAMPCERVDDLDLGRTSGPASVKTSVVHRTKRSTPALLRRRSLRPIFSTEADRVATRAHAAVRCAHGRKAPAHRRPS